MSMNKLVLKAEINEDLKNIIEIYNEINKTRSIFDSREPTTLELVGLSGLLQSYYNGVERVFKKIARDIDDNLPKDMSFHADLLNQMALDIKGVRPPLISRGVYNKLKLLLNFRHRFRHAYHWELRWAKIRELLCETESVMEGFKKEMEEFMDFLDELIEKT